MTKISSSARPNHLTDGNLTPSFLKNESLAFIFIKYTSMSQIQSLLPSGCELSANFFLDTANLFQFGPSH